MLTESSEPFSVSRTTQERDQYDAGQGARDEARETTTSRAGIESSGAGPDGSHPRVTSRQRWTGNHQRSPEGG